MNYLTKSLIQNLFALLPNRAGNYCYKRIQKKFGNIYKTDESVKFFRAINSFEFLNENQKNFCEKKILEIGTGYSPAAAISFWLLGFREVYTIDLNKSIDPYSIHMLIDWIAKNKEEIFEIKGINKKRVNIFINLVGLTYEKILQILRENGFIYEAPFKLSNSKFEANYFDFIYSYDVLEHVPLDQILEIFKISKTILSNSGFMMHRINYADHFAKSDKNISKINFLRFNKISFKILAGNRFMYMNRLRDCDFEKIFTKLKLNIVSKESVLDAEIKEKIIGNKIKIHKEFQNKNIDSLSTLASFFVLNLK